MTMEERIETISKLPTNQMTFEALQNLPKSNNSDVIPNNPIK
jgi:hypothetical protein